MSLLLQTVGILVATVLVARVVLAGAGPRRYVVACLAVVAAVTATLAFTSVDSQLKVMGDNRKADDAARAAGATDDGLFNLSGQRLGVNTAFTDWVRTAMPGHDTYYLVMSPGPEVSAMPHWITYRMLPHVATAIEGQDGTNAPQPPSAPNATKADWVVFYGVEPRKWALRKQFHMRLRHFAPGLALGRIES
jgi:hypothetical protein